MGVRSVVGTSLRSVIGPQRVESLVRVEHRLREAAAQRLAVTSPKAAASPEPRFGQSDPFVDFPRPLMTRHELLHGLHRVLEPRTYLEIGIREGSSLQLSRAATIGVDPAFSVTREIACDVRLFRSTSDDFFSRADAFDSFGGVPVDLAFIDGMHLSEYVMRDFMNTEPHLARTAVVVLDDMLPRNPREAARDRSTRFWAGDVFKVAEILRRHRPDLVVLDVNTGPTGTVVIVGVDPGSAVLSAVYEAELAYCRTPDPQNPDPAIMRRSSAVSPVELLALPQWSDLVAQRDAGTANLDDLRTALLSLPSAG